MNYRQYKLADFCHIIGESSFTANGVTTNHHTCKEHGPIHLIRYYGLANGPVVWTCPQCLEKHLECELAEAEQSEDECFTCKSKDNLISCELCGDMCCPSHRIETCCEECTRGMDEYVGRGYSGV